MNITDEMAPVSTLRPGLGDMRPRVAMTKSVRVLVLDDNEDDFAFVRILLNKSQMCTYHLEWVPTEAAALAALQRGKFDVALFDYKLGGTTGLEILRTLQSQQCDIPIILLTGSENPELDQAALDAGAADYLCKGSLDTTRLERAIRYSINHAQMLSALRESQAQLQLFMRSVPCAVCIYDENGAILFQNEIFKRHFSVQAVIAARKLTSAANGPTQYSHGNRHWLITTFPMVERSGRNLQGLAGIDITQRRLVERELLRVSDAEKNRIGSDLHDGLGQYLTGISCLSAALRDKLQRSAARRRTTQPRFLRSCRRQLRKRVRSRADFARCNSRRAVSKPRSRISRFKCNGCTVWTANSNLEVRWTSRRALRCTSIGSRRKRSTTRSSTPRRNGSK